MSVQLLRRKFTVEQYHRMVESGILCENDRVELIRGEIVEMSPIGRRHAACVKRLNRLFNRKLGDSVLIVATTLRGFLRDGTSSTRRYLFDCRSRRYDCSI